MTFQYGETPGGHIYPLDPSAYKQRQFHEDIALNLDVQKARLQVDQNAIRSDLDDAVKNLKAEITRALGLIELDGGLVHEGPTPPEQDMLWLYVDPEYDPNSTGPLPTYTTEAGETIEHGELVEWSA